MSIREKLKLRLGEEVAFDSDGHTAMCMVIVELVEEKFTSTNTDSQKCTCYVLPKGLCIPGEQLLNVNKSCPQHGTLLASA